MNIYADGDGDGEDNGVGDGDGDGDGAGHNDSEFPQDGAGCNSVDCAWREDHCVPGEIKGSQPLLTDYKTVLTSKCLPFHSLTAQTKYPKDVLQKI